MANKGKFKTLVHNGVVFPPDYEPKGYTLNGEKIPNTGDDSAEEMLWKSLSKNLTCSTMIAKASPRVSARS